MRLVDADEFIKDECNHCDGACESLNCDCLECNADCRCDFIKDIEDAPAIDAVPVKHGEWIDPAAEDCYRCSVCEEYTNMEMPRLLYHYCPNCGAKMDGEK